MAARLPGSRGGPQTAKVPCIGCGQCPLHCQVNGQWRLKPGSTAVSRRPAKAFPALPSGSQWLPTLPNGEPDYSDDALYTVAPSRIQEVIDDPQYQAYLAAQRLNAEIED